MARTTSLLRFFGLSALISACGAVMVFCAAFLYVAPTLPEVDKLRDIELQTPLRIYSADGQIIGEFGEKRRSPVSFQEVPDTFVKAFLAAEDDRFFEHRGVDLTSLLRAASQLIASGSIQTGGSTITMQVAKNYFLSQERTFTRKFTEIFLAIEIERKLSKGDILELYLNKIFLGNHSYGIEAAAQTYYGKSIKELSLAQMAMIAGLPKAPSAYNPIANPERARIRRNWILRRMHALGYVDKSDYENALAQDISARRHGTQLDVSAAYAAEMVRLEMLQRYGRDAYENGYSVVTTVDSTLQLAANQAVINGVIEYDQRHGYRGPEQQWPLPAELNDAQREALSNKLSKIGAIGPWHPALTLHIEEKSATFLLATGEQTTLKWDQGFAGTVRYINEDRNSYEVESVDQLIAAGDVVRLRMSSTTPRRWLFSQLPEIQGALVSLDADTGAILSLVGGYSYQRSSFNRVTQAARQPGSAFKPFIYTAALANGFTPASIINDAPIVFSDSSLGGTWRPSNSNGKFNGPMRLRKALYLSRNLVSIRVLRELGIGTAIDYMARFGFDSDTLPRDLSLALGSHSLTPLEVVTGYATFANGGYKVAPWLIEQIIDRDGNTLYRADPKIACRDCDSNASGIDDIGSMEADSLDDLQAASNPTTTRMAERVVDEEVVFLIDSILKDVVSRGTGRKALSLERSDAAGKTGTTNGPTDAWFSGYSSGVVTSAWVGFDQNKKLGRREYGGSVALPIWIDYMKVALQGRQERHLKQPQGVVSVRIDPETGALAAPGQSDAIFEYFRSENTPTQVSSGSGASSPYGDSDSEPIELF